MGHSAAAFPPEADASAASRAELVRHIAAEAGIADEALLRAFASVPRHLFIPVEQQPWAYEDRALPIGWGQTISQPTMIAIMLRALDLKPADRVLEVGAGCGYAAALVARVARKVHAIEIVPELAASAQGRLRQLGIDNAEVVLGNGRMGLPQHAPYDKILVSAGAEQVPDELISELASGGTLAIPVGTDAGHELLIGKKDAAGGMTWQKSISCIFVPLVGQA